MPSNNVYFMYTCIRGLQAVKLNIKNRCRHPFVRQRMGQLFAIAPWRHGDNHPVVRICRVSSGVFRCRVFHSCVFSVPDTTQFPILAVGRARQTTLASSLVNFFAHASLSSCDLIDSRNKSLYLLNGRRHVAVAVQPVARWFAVITVGPWPRGTLLSPPVLPSPYRVVDASRHDVVSAQ